MKKIIGTLIGIGLLLVSGCATSAPPPTATPVPTPTPVPVLPTSTPTSTFVPPTPAYTVEVTEDVEYTRPLQSDVPAQKLDVYTPTEPGPWPVVVLLHAYANTKDTLACASLGEELAGRGAVVFVPNWRPSMSGEATKNDGLLVREASEELACAVRFARARAADYGGDPGRVTMVGHADAGAPGMGKALVGDDSQLWEEFASSRGGPPPQVDCLVSGVSAHVDAFVGYGGAYTAVEFLKEKDPELWELCSPFANIGKNPSLLVHLIHGEQDQVVSLEKAVQFHEALVDAGYDATLTVVDGKHPIPSSGPAREAWIQAIMEAARR